MPGGGSRGWPRGGAPPNQKIGGDLEAEGPHPHRSRPGTSMVPQAGGLEVDIEPGHTQRQLQRQQLQPPDYIVNYSLALVFVFRVVLYVLVLNFLFKIPGGTSLSWPSAAHWHALPSHMARLSRSVGVRGGILHLWIQGDGRHDWLLRRRDGQRLVWPSDHDLSCHLLLCSDGAFSASTHLVSSSWVGEHAHWEVVKEILSGITLKNGKPALSLYCGFAHPRVEKWSRRYYLGSR